MHIGTGKENYDFSSSGLHSDTLSSALAAIRATQGKSGDTEHFIDSFIISSAFPYWKNNFFCQRFKVKLK